MQPLSYLRWHLMGNQAQLATRLVAAGGRFWIHPGTTGMVVARGGLVMQLGQHQTRQVERFLGVRSSAAAQTILPDQFERGSLRVLLNETCEDVDSQLLQFAP